MVKTSLAAEGKDKAWIDKWKVDVERWIVSWRCCGVEVMWGVWDVFVKLLKEV